MTFDRSLPNEEIVPQIISEVVELEHAIQAIAVVMVMPNGSIKTKLAFKEGNKLPLLAGVDLFHDDLRRQIGIESDQPPQNILGPGPSK